MATKINADIQAMRGVAILLVLAQHLPNRLPAAQWVHEVFRHVAFWGGVDLFFVISGYVITRSLVDGGTVSENGKISGRAFVTFWKRRFLRLLPASWFWLAMAIATAGLLTATQPHEPWPLLRTVLYTVGGAANYLWVDCAAIKFAADRCVNGNIGGAFWSLSLEEQFYAALSLCLLCFGLRSFLLAGFAVIAGYTVYFAFQSADAPFFGLAWAFRPHGLVLGVCLALLWNDRLSSFMPGPIVRRLGILSLVALLCVVPAAMPLKWAMPCMAIIGAATVLLALPDGALSGRRPYLSLEWIGGRSYSLYLCHLPIFLLVREGLARTFGPEILSVDSTILTLGSTFFAVGLALLAADLSYRFVEQPFRRLGRRQPLPA